MCYALLNICEIIKTLNNTDMKKQQALTRRFLTLLVLFLISYFSVVAQQAVFNYANQAAQNGISLAMNGITGPATAQTFCEGTKFDVFKLDQSASSDPTVKYIEITSGSDITKLELDGHYNAAGSGTKACVIAYWNGAYDATPDGVVTADFIGYDQACSTPMTSTTFPSGVRTVRIYRKVNYDGTTLGTGTAYGDGSTTNFKTINVYTGAPAPVLSVSPTTLSGFTYVSGSGPSANQSFAVSGTNLTAGVNVVITAPTNYEVSTAAGGPYGATATIANAAGGALAATNIYVRLKAGLSVALYNGSSVSVSGGGASVAPTVGVSGSVTSGALIPLTAPTVGAATSINGDGFTANWSTVANASGGYIVNVYKAGILQKSVNVAGQASNSTVITGLTASTAYTYKVIAVGDLLTYSNSVESAAANVTTTVDSASSACELPVYNSDFKDWVSRTWVSTSSNPFVLGPGNGAGEGFTITEDASIDATAGKYWIEGSTSGRELIFKPMDFLVGGAGGYVELDFELQNDGSNRVFEISTHTATQVSIVDVNLTGGSYDLVNLKAEGTSMGTGTTLTPGLVGTWINGTTVQLPKSATGRIRVAFKIPSLSGTQSIGINPLRKLMPLRGVKVCQSVGALKYVASTDYMSCTDDPTGLLLTGTKGGSKVTGSLNVQGWNITGPVTMAITGDDAAKFLLPDASLTQAEGLAGQTVTVEFTPSVLAGVSNAKLILSSPGAADYCVSLTGLTSTGATPEITTPVQTWEFATQVIATTTQNIPISGVNLTGPLTLSLTGTNATQFSLSTTSLTLAQALAGTPITITYQGGITAPLTQNANLVISGGGATSVTLPLVGLTYSSQPEMFNLITKVTPGGTGIVSQDLGGTTFPNGTTVKLTATPETGYRFKRWTDNGSTALVRNVLMTSNKIITAEFEPGSPIVISPFNAYTPTVVGNTSFTARWSAVAGSTGYVVKVYDTTGTLIYTSPSGAGTTRNITGLTLGTNYTYTVTSSPGNEVSNAVSVTTTGTPPVPACGTVN